ncbi:MAG: four-carbon acid sugar kinase family protein [Chloroflexota bacterium]|nr:four-carbon acid sugar kinase family protein [Chloroflexota bacterium]
MRMGVVADDITGANDIGIMFAKAGYVTQVYVWDGPGTLARASQWEQADVVILDTDSRLDPPQLAYDKVFAATRELQEAGCKHFHNKTCSVFRGNIGVEFDAMLDALGERFAVVVLGFPKNGRLTMNGVHYVHGKRLEKSEFRRDPVHPMTQSNLVDILQEQTTRRVGLLTHEVVKQGPQVLQEHIAEIRPHCDYLILDVSDQHALHTIARAVRDEPVLCGSSALAEELAAVWEVPSATAPYVALPRRTGAGVLCVAGSLMPQTVAQIRHLHDRGTPIWELDTLRLFDEAERERVRLTVALVHHLRKGETVLLHASNDAASVEQTRAEGARRGMARAEVSRLVSGALARIVAEVVVQAEVNRVVMAGGDTSAAICRGLGITGMRVWQEIEPGLPSCLSLTDPPLFLVLKSGSFGSPDFLEQAIDHVMQR